MNPAADLAARWRERDSRYALRLFAGVRHPIEPGEAAAIRLFRESEAWDLTGHARDVALSAAVRWQPPTVDGR